MSQKTIVITGPTSGIGRAAARGLARPGRLLVLVGRNAERLTATARELRELGAEVDTEQCDLSSLAPFVLAAELRDLLVSSGRSCVVVTASDAHRYVKRLELNDLQSERRGTAGFRAYAASKLANILFTRELARKLEGTGVVAHAFHPGFVASDLGKNNGFVGRGIMAVCRPFIRSAEEGADTLVWLALSDEVMGTGGYWFTRRPHPFSAAASDDGAAHALWAASEQIVAALPV